VNFRAAKDILGALVTTPDDLANEPTFVEWVTKTKAVLRSTFGATSPQLQEFEAAVKVRNEGYTSARRNAIDLWRDDAAKRGKAVLKGAIFTLETLLDEKSPLDEASVDPELWAHVQGLVASNDWAKVPAEVAIFVEDRVRMWAQDPRQNNGATMVGKTLYATALGESGPLRLGRQASEWEGWRSLGMGLAQAVGNVDRHRLQRRDDARRYALGVLGLGSLLLTQLRYEHPAAVLEAEMVEPAAERGTDEAARPGGY